MEKEEGWMQKWSQMGRDDDDCSGEDHFLFKEEEEETLGSFEGLKSVD